MWASGVNWPKSIDLGPQQLDNDETNIWDIPREVCWGRKRPNKRFRGTSEPGRGWGTDGEVDEPEIGRQLPEEEWSVVQVPLRD